MIAGENNCRLNETGVVTCAKTCEDVQPPLLLGVPLHAVQNPLQAVSSSQPGESLWRGVLEILSGFFPQLKDGKNNEQARREMLMVTKMIMMSSLQRARELLWGRWTRWWRRCPQCLASAPGTLSSASSTFGMGRRSSKRLKGLLL